MPKPILRKDQVEESWSVLIKNAQGRAGEIFRNTEAFIKENNVPPIVMTKKSIAPGLLKGLFGKTREFLVVVDSSSSKLKPYQIFVNARDYGNNLDVSWYMTYRPSLRRSLFLWIPFISKASLPLLKLDLFDHQDLRAYATVVHKSVQDSVDKLMLDLHQDPSKIDRKSRGFLGIS